ncbi:MAG TPA: pitrilysin family protein [Longimicrobium sp.]|jgi:zinc protease
MNRRFLLPALAGALIALPAAAQQQPTEQPPAPGQLRPFTIPPAREFRLANGVRVVVVEKHTLPIVTGRVLVSAGSMYEPAEKNGLASLTAQVLREGTQSLTGPQIAERMEALGATFGTGAGFEFATANVTAPKSTFGDAMELAASTVTSPSFAESELTRVRGQMMAGAVRLNSTVEGLAGLAHNRALFDSATGYSRPVAGTAATLPRIVRDDAVAFHRRMYSPANTTLLLVGDVSQDEARRIAERAFGSWSVPGATAASLPRPGVRQASGTRIILVDRPGSVQSGIRVGHLAVPATDPDLIPFTALSQVLGGGFRSRLMMSLRERHGWTYGAFSDLTSRPQSGTFMMITSARTNATDSAVAEIVSQYRRIATEPVPADELRAAAANVVGSFPSSIQTVQGLADRIQLLLQNGQPLDYYNTYRERFTAVTPAEITRIARTRLTPDALTIVVAGDLSKIEAPIRALNLGTVEVLDPNGVKVR